MDSDHFSSMNSDDENMKLVSNKTDHKTNIDEAFLLAIKNENNVVIVTKNKDEIIANKKVLSIFSSLLRSLFQESESAIHLPDCSSSSVRHVLNIITNSFTNIDTDSLDDLNDIIETARVMDIDISNIYVEQSISTSRNESSFASGFVTPSTQRPPGFSQSSDKSGNITSTLSSMHTSDLNGSDLWWLSGFSAFTYHGEQIKGTYDKLNTSSPTQVSGFLNQQPKNKDTSMKHVEERDGNRVDTDLEVQAVRVINDESESTNETVQTISDSMVCMVSGFINLPHKDKEGKTVALNGSESVEEAKSKITPTPGFSNVDPPSKSEHFAPEHNSTKLNGTVISCSNISSISDSLKSVNTEARRGGNRKQNVQERFILVPRPAKQIGKSSRGDGQSRAIGKKTPGIPREARKAGGGRGLNQEGMPITGEVSEVNKGGGRGLTQKWMPIPGEVNEVSRGGGRGLNKELLNCSGIDLSSSRGTGRSTLRTGRRNVLSVGTIMKFLDQSDDEN